MTPLGRVPNWISLMLFSACLWAYPHLSAVLLSYKRTMLKMSRQIWTLPPPQMKTLTHAEVHPFCKHVYCIRELAFLQFGGAPVSDALSVKPPSRCICNFLCKCVFCLQRESASWGIQAWSGKNMTLMENEWSVRNVHFLLYPDCPEVISSLFHSLSPIPSSSAQ